MMANKVAVVRFLKSASKTAFSRYLLLTNTAITVCLSATGDIMQQRYEILRQRKKEWDPLRTARICTTAFFIGPTCHYWYLMLDRFFPGRALRMVTKKILIDQIVFSPVNISMFLVIMGVLEGSSTSQIKLELVRDGADLLKAEWIVWPPAQYLNFYFLPTRFRVLFDNTVSLGFDCYYSYVKYRKHKTSDGREVKDGKFSNRDTDMFGEDEMEVIIREICQLQTCSGFLTDSECSFSH